MAPFLVLVAERQHRVEGEHQPDQDGGVPEVAVDVLEDQREPGLAGVGLVRLRDPARRRREPERPVVGLAVVVAGHPEAQREDQDDQRRREGEPAERLAEVGRALHAVPEAGRVERREVRRGVVVAAHERADRGVDDERGEHHECRQRRQPPPIGAQGPFLDRGPGGPLHSCVGRRHRHLRGHVWGTLLPHKGTADKRRARLVRVRGRRSWTSDRSARFHPSATRHAARRCGPGREARGMRIALVTESFYPSRRQHHDHRPAGRGPSRGRRPRPPAGGAGAGADHLPRCAGGPDRLAGHRDADRSAGPGGAGRLRARPRPRHLSRTRGPQGPQARLPARVPDAPGGAVARPGRPRRSPGCAKVPVARRPRAGHQPLDARRARRPPASSRRRCGRPASTSRRTARSCATTACTPAGRGSAPPAGRASWSATSASCPGATAYAAWSRSTRCPAPGWSSWARARSGAGWPTGCPDATFTGTLTGSDLSTALATLDVLVHPGEEETCCHVLREAAASGVPSSPRRPGAPSTPSGTDAPGCSTTRPGPAGSAGPWPRSSATRTCGPRWATQARTRAENRSWRIAVEELVGVHYPETLRRSAMAPAA